MLAAANAALQEQLAKQQVSDPESFQKSLAEQYKQILFNLCRLESHIISIHIPGMDEGIEKFWLDKEFEYHKITREDYESAKLLISEYEDYDFSDDEWGVELRMSAMMAAYSFLARCFLHMSQEEFDNAEWEHLKDVLNACLYRTEKSIVLDNKNLTDLFFLGNSRNITKTESDIIDMYRLWKKWKTKPWEVNGNVIYPEDINSVMRLEDIILAAEKHEREKEAARARMKKKGGR